METLHLHVSCGMDWFAGCDEYLVLTDTLVPQPLVEDFVFKGSCTPHNTLLDVSDGGSILNNFNHAYNTAAKMECKYCINISLICSLHLFKYMSLTYSVTSGDAAVR